MIDLGREEREDERVGQEEQRDEQHREPWREPFEEERAGRDRREKRDAAVQERASRACPHQPRDKRARFEQRGEIENIRAEDDADTELVMTGEKRSDGGGNFGASAPSAVRIPSSPSAKRSRPPMRSSATVRTKLETAISRSDPRNSPIWKTRPFTAATCAARDRRAPPPFHRARSAHRASARGRSRPR